MSVMPGNFARCGSGDVFVRLYVLVHALEERDDGGAGEIDVLAPIGDELQKSCEKNMGRWC